MRIKNILLIILSLSGILDSVYTQIIHNKLIESQFTYRSFCAISEFINCDVVIASKYGKILGISNSYYGIVTYSLILIFVLFYSIKGIPERKTFYSCMFGFSLFTSLFSIYLFAVSLLVIKALCLMCIGIYIINLSMLAIASHEVIKERLSPVRILYSQALVLLRKHPLVSAFFVIISTSAIVFLYIRDIRIEKREWRERYRDVLSGTAVVHNIKIGDSPFRGSADAKITIVEFSDFQCPFCKNAHDVLEKIYSDYKDKMRIVFKHFPLDNKCNILISRSIHANACNSAIASLCADEQGKFWEYNKILFDNQKKLDYSNLIKLAEKVGLNGEEFKKCLMLPGEKMQKIVSDIHQGYELGVRSTPTLFLNGKMLKGAVPEWLLREMIEKELGSER